MLYPLSSSQVQCSIHVSCTGRHANKLHGKERCERPKVENSIEATSPLPVMAAATFASLQSALAADPSLGSKIKGVLCIDLGEDGVWLVDCVAGDVKQATSGSKPKADCTITMKEIDFVALAAGRMSGMSAYMSGKMRLSGKTAMAQQFADLVAAARKAKKAPATSAPKASSAPTPSEPPAASPAAASTASPPAGFASNDVFARIATNLSADPSLRKKVNGSFLFRLSDGPGGASAAWTVDARKGSAGGSVTPSDDVVSKPDCTISISDADFAALAAGKLSPMGAYMSGKLKLKGRAALAQKLAALLADGKPKAKL